MTYLLTGASGFTGQYLKKALSTGPNKLLTLGRSPGNDIVADLTLAVPDLSNLTIDYVIHAAGKAHMIPKTEQEKNDFMLVNVTGTQNLLEGLSGSNQKLKSFIFFSSVSVYGKEAGELIDESSPLLATDPYGQSKIEAEKLVAGWCTKQSVPYYILRLPLVIGNAAPGNLGAMVNGIKSGRYFSIGKANAKKSMVLASDVAEFVKDIKGPQGIYNLTDGCHPSFAELEQFISSALHRPAPLKIPYVVARLMALFGDLLGKRAPINTRKLNKITQTLTFSSQKAATALQWKPAPVLKGWTDLH